MSEYFAVKSLRAGYGPVRVLHGLDFVVDEGDVFVILGANGAGKTTTLRALTGMAASSGSVRLRGQELVGLKPEQISATGVAHVPQGRGTFGGLTVEENLRVGAYRKAETEIVADMETWFELFPRLRERRTQLAAGMSGGEQQMLAIARALMSRPKLLLLDEPSLGLAPNLTRAVFDSLAQVNRTTGLTIIVVEQNAHLALAIGTNAVVLEAGQIVASGSAESMQHDDAIRRAYLGY